uniref:Axonemal dynein light intermediate polypeptide 1 n=1 Tax=Mola mola TaxID=94237 RepID=A0A3Q3XEL6_MOLML
MIPPAASLLKYDHPVCVSKTSDRKSPKVTSSQQHVNFFPVPPPPKAKPSHNEAGNQGNEQILNTIFPPREWREGNELWVQRVSSVVCTRTDVVHLEELLDAALRQKQARETGICPERRELYIQFFDELIRQVTISCAERGLLLVRVRDEIHMTIAAYQTMYESSMAFSLRKSLRAEQDVADMKKRISDLEAEVEDLRKQLNEEKAKCDANERRENERRQVEEKKHAEQIQFLKRANQQLKAQLEGMITSTK